MKTFFENINKSYCAGKYRGVFMVLSIGVFCLFFAGVGLAQPLPPHPPGVHNLPGPHHLPGPPVVAPHHPGPPPHPGWVWVPGYHKGHRWVPGHWSEPKRHR
jgi:hypothetical protein